MRRYVAVVVYIGLMGAVLPRGLAAGQATGAGRARPAPSAAWWNTAFTHRVGLVLRRGPAMVDQPAVVTGHDLYRATGFSRLPVSGVRVVGPDGKAAVMQVDQRDARGFHVGRGDAVLDATDEIVFLVSRKPKATACYWVYWSTQAQAQPEPAASGAQESVPKKDRVVQLRMRTRHWDVGFNATGTATPEKNERGNHARGAISRLAFKGVPITNINTSWGFYLPRHPFGSGPGRFRWTGPSVVRRGPIRTLVEMRRSGAELTGPKRTVCMRGDVVHTFAVYHQAPVIDAEFTLDYRATQDKWAGAFSFPMYVGKRAGLGDTLLVCVAGEVYRRAITQQDLDDWYPMLYRTPLPEEGWFAWVDPAESRGLAVFYEKMAPIESRASWVSYRPVHHPKVRVRVPPSGHVDNVVTWQHRSLTSATRMRYTLRLVGLTHADGDRVRSAYHLWARPTGEYFDAAWPEKR